MNWISTLRSGIALVGLAVWSVHAAVLPEDRADLLYHSYDGGNVTVDGPSLLVRKQATTNTSVFYNYYIDNISSASIDVEVLVGATRYSEERTEQSAGIDYVHGKTTMNFSYTSSEENDYEAKSYHFNMSQDFFGDLTTLSLGYSKGSDTIRSSTDDTYLEFADRQNYRVGLSQILTKDLIMAVGFETITDEGSLRNPYRAYSYCVAGCTTRGFAPEKYPATRTSNALALRGSYFLPYRAAIHAEYKRYQDSWGIDANTMQLGYSQPWRDWMFDLRYRIYSQDKADFYSDIFDVADQFNFMGRDKELSTFGSTAVGITVSYEFTKTGWWIFEKGSANLSWDRISFTYDDFRDARQTSATVLPGTEPFYAFDADVIQLFVSLWY